MKKVMLLTVGVLMGIAVMAQPGMGQRSGQGPRGESCVGDGQGKGDRKTEMVEKLSLTDVQQNQIEEMRLAFKASSQAISNQVGIKQAQLKALLATDKPDEKKVDALVKGINDLKGAQFEGKVDHRMEVRAILDEKQKVIFDGMPLSKRGRRNRY